MELNSNIFPQVNPERTIDIILDAISNVVSYELAVVLSIENDNYLKVKKAKGILYTPRLKDYRISLSERDNLREFIELGKVHVFNDDVEHGEKHLDTYYDILDLPDGHSCLIAPLHIEGRTVGLLTMDHRSCNIFTDDVIRLIETLSKIIALALAQSMLADSLLTEKEALVFERNSLLDKLNYTLNELIGVSDAWLEVIEKIKVVAPLDVSVLIQGETGTGKEKVARAIHNLSKRANRHFIALNCSALVTSLVESELFGHEKGAFTGAISKRRGRFELANNGTLFLDEIGDLPLEVQPKLLRAIQEQTFERIGGEVSINSNVRIICATNVDLEKAVNEGKFREDLFYRLNVFPIYLPPLRERVEDIIPLSNYFLNELAKKFNKIENLNSHRKEFKLTQNAVDYLLSREWPGNVRELFNVLERAVILCQDDYIDVIHLDSLNSKKINELSFNFKRKKTDTINKSDIKTLNEVIKEQILNALKLTNGKIYGKDGAASSLGLKPSTLQSKMKKLGIKLNKQINPV